MIFGNITISPGAYEIEYLYKENQRVINEKVYFTEVNYPLVIKPNVSTLASIIENSPGRGRKINFSHDDSLCTFSGNKPTVKHEENNHSEYPVNFL